jgi:excisionase family DNA binding protein
MAEVTATQAAEILSTSHMTIHRRVDDGSLPARRQGLARIVKIDVGDLRRFAETNGYRFDEKLAKQYGD